MANRRTFITGMAALALAPRAWPKEKRVRVGVCSKDVAGAAKAGFDYVEPAAADVAGMTDDQFRDFSALVKSAGIRCEAFNSFIRRPDLKVVGESVPTDALRDYMETCL